MLFQADVDVDPVGPQVHVVHIGQIQLGGRWPADRPAAPLDLGDIAIVFGPEEDRLWSDTIAARLAQQWPTTYAGTTPASPRR